MDTPEPNPSPETQTVILTREDAVKTQLDTAIWLWFIGEPPGPIHAMADNALTLLNNLAGKKREESHFYSKEMHELVGRKKLKELSVFLKHASADPNRAMKFSPMWSEYLMFDAINLCAKILPPVTLLMATFGARFVTLHYSLGRFTREEIAKYLPKGATVEEVTPLSRIEFLKTVLPLFAEGGFAQR